MTSNPAPFTSTLRAIAAKWAIGSSSVKGWIHAGIASIGVNAPRRDGSGAGSGLAGPVGGTRRGSAPSRLAGCAIDPRMLQGGDLQAFRT